MKCAFGALCGLFVLINGGAALADGKSGYTRGKGIYFETQDKSFSANIGSRVQFRFTQDNPDVGNSVSSFDIRRAKFSITGHVYENWKYKIQAAWSGSSTTLEDASFTYVRNKLAQIWLGQGKVLFGRQQLTSSGKQQFVDRSIASGAFAPARSQGLALIGRSENKKLEYNVGVYDDFDGDNVRTNSDDNLMYTGRLVYTPFGEYKPNESAHDYPQSSKLAIGVKALSDTTTTFTEVDNKTLGLEVAYKILGFNLVGEFFDRTIEVAGSPDAETDGYYLQVGYLFPNKKAEVAGRIAAISPNVTGASADSTEAGIAFSYYLDGHRYKIQTDYRQIENDAAPATNIDVVRAQLQFTF